MALPEAPTGATHPRLTMRLTHLTSFMAPASQVVSASQDPSLAHDFLSHLSVNKAPHPPGGREAEKHRPVLSAASRDTSLTPSAGACSLHT